MGQITGGGPAVGYKRELSCDNERASGRVIEYIWLSSSGNKSHWLRAKIGDDTQAIVIATFRYKISAAETGVEQAQSYHLRNRFRFEDEGFNTLTTRVVVSWSNRHGIACIGHD